MKFVALATILLAAAPAAAVDVRAVDIRFLGGLDFFLTSDPKADLMNAELGIVAKTEVRDLAKRVDLKLDFLGREGFIGNSHWNQLLELYARVKNLGGRLTLTVGRFRTPGGFWLIADGGMLEVKYADFIGQSVFGGLRSFTTGRRDTWMTDAEKVALPLVGTSIWLRHRIVTGAVTFSWARDAIDLHKGRAPDGRNLIERHARDRPLGGGRGEDEYFLDGYVALWPHEKVYLSVGASLGTRYDVKFAASNPYGDTTLAIATLGAVGAYGILEVRPIKNLRLSYSGNYERVRLIQSQLLILKPDGTPVETASGSFQDHVLRAAWRVWRATRFDVSDRLRYRENTDLEHRLLAGIRADDLWKGLGFVFSIGVDLNTLATVKHDRVIYTAGLSFERTFLQLGAGILYTDGIGSGLAFSSRTDAAAKNPVELFPYVLESNRVAYLRAFGSFWKMFAGLDLEVNVEVGQVRTLLQIGAAL